MLHSLILSPSLQESRHRHKHRHKHRETPAVDNHHLVLLLLSINKEASKQEQLLWQQAGLALGQSPQGSCFFFFTHSLTHSGQHQKTSDCGPGSYRDTYPLSLSSSGLSSPCIYSAQPFVIYRSIDPSILPFFKSINPSIHRSLSAASLIEDIVHLQNDCGPCAHPASNPVLGYYLLLLTRSPCPTERTSFKLASPPLLLPSPAVWSPTTTTATTHAPPSPSLHIHTRHPHATHHGRSRAASSSGCARLRA